MTHRISWWRIGAVILPVTCSACSSKSSVSDTVGSYMPVVNDRCENWQCFTSDGKAASDAIKAERLRAQQAQKAGQQPAAAAPAPMPARQAETPSDDDFYGTTH